MDASYEEDLMKNVKNFKTWWYYLEHKKDARPEVRNLIYERACRSLPRSYKLWFKYLNERMANVKELCVTDVAYDDVNNCFERSLVHMHKFPRIWQEYLQFLMKQKLITRLRRIFDRSLKALPVTQHMKWVWPLYLSFVKDAGVPEMAARVYRRYLKIEPKDREEFIKYLRKAGKLDQAAQQLAHVVNDEKFVSQQGKSKHDLWTELLTLIVKNPTKIKSLNVDAIIRGGIRRFTHEVGNLWTSLADYYIRLGHFDKARDIYEEGINTVSTVRDFSVIFDAYTQYEESMLAAKMEVAEGEDVDEDDEDDVNADIDLRLMRLENLMKRQPLLLSSVLLRQNPHNVKEWKNRIQLFCDGELKDPTKAILTYTDAVTTVDPQKASGKPHTLWVSFAHFYEKHGDLVNARTIFEKATVVNFKNVEDLAALWCQYAEMELRHKKYPQARQILRQATVLPSALERAQYKEGDRVPVQKRLFRSTKLWTMYADIEESVGTLESTKAVYEQMVDLKVVTPQIMLNYAQFMEENKYFEDSFRVYEKGIALFSYPHVYPLWVAYLRKFVSRYKGAKIERARDLFEQSLENCPAKESENVYLLYAKYEEDFGLIRRSMDVYARLCKACTAKNRLKMYYVYLSRCKEFFGLTKTRTIFDEATKALTDAEMKPICMKYAELERKLGEIDRSRAVFLYGSQFCDPAKAADYWGAWHQFEVKHGNEDTFKEMLRVRRSVTAQFSQVSMMSSDLSAAPIENANKDNKRKREPANSMEELDAEAPATKKIAPPTPPLSSIPESKAPEGGVDANPEEIDLDLDDLDGDDDNDVDGVEQQQVPASVFGGASGDGEAVGAKERFQKKTAT